MNYEALLEQLTPELVRTCRRALELGRWPDGRPVNDEQKQHCMRAVIAYEQRHLPAAQRVGFIERGRKAGPGCTDPATADGAALRWAAQDDKTP